MESFTTTPAESYIELRDRIETFILSLDSRVKANHGLADWHEERGNEEGASRFRLRASLLKGVIGDARGFLLGDNDCTGDLDTRTGTVQHDGVTCPIHEAE
jgi:hypothetical protein